MGRLSEPAARIFGCTWGGCNKLIVNLLAGLERRSECLYGIRTSLLLSPLLAGDHNPEGSTLVQSRLSPPTVFEDMEDAALVH